MSRILFVELLMQGKLTQINKLDILLNFLSS